MIKRTFLGQACSALAAFLVASVGSGCAVLLPTSQSTSKSKWQNYDEAKAAFDNIVPFQTSVNDLKAFGFDPASPNVEQLTYLDVIQRFLPNESVSQEDLDPGVLECLQARQKCRALEVRINEIKSKREGNALLDIFGFRRKTHETGWRFKALLVVREELVVYKLYSGEAVVDRTERRVKPLGPLQELDSFLLRSLPSVR